jgi:hypothetical protein
VPGELPNKVFSPAQNGALSPKNAKHFPHISLIRPISLISPKSYLPIFPKIKHHSPTFKKFSKKITLIFPIFLIPPSRHPLTCNKKVINKFTMIDKDNVLWENMNKGGMTFSRTDWPKQPLFNAEFFDAVSYAKLSCEFQEWFGVVRIIC